MSSCLLEGGHTNCVQDVSNQLQLRLQQIVTLTPYIEQYISPFLQASETRRRLQLQNCGHQSRIVANSRI